MLYFLPALLHLSPVTLLFCFEDLWHYDLFFIGWNLLFYWLTLNKPDQLNLVASLRRGDTVWGDQVHAAVTETFLLEEWVGL